jgi:hypothetical protein
MWEAWQEKVTFLVVYIREAHPEEGWLGGYAESG